MLRYLLPMLVLVAVSAFADDALFKMKDPSGDDRGAGTLTYPQGIEWEYGDLDLTEFSAEKGRDGVWFEVRFRNRVRSPDGLTIKTAAEPIRNFVQYDFFNINVDIYIDTDGQPGSGNVSTVPGRQLEIARESAWEKAVVLTPRPYPAQSLLGKYMENNREAQVKAERGRISQAETEAIEAEVEALVEDRFYFPTRIQVRGRKIRFFVPNDFLGGTPQPSWQYAVVVTAADIEQRVDLSFLDQGQTRLMMVPVAEASAIHSWGFEYGSDPNQPPVADVLLPTRDAQRIALSDYDAISGRLAVVRGLSPEGFASYTREEKPKQPMVNASAKPKPKPKPAMEKPKTEKVAETKAAVPKPEPETVVAKPAKEEPKPAVEPQKNVDDLLGPSEVQPKQGQERGIAERLRELETLKTEGLITQEEYERLRKKILSDL